MNKVTLNMLILILCKIFLIIAKAIKKNQFD